MTARTRPERPAKTHQGAQGRRTAAGRAGQQRSLSEFRPQAQNANKHTARGLGMLDTAMTEDGYVAPITTAADGETIDGSARLERAAERFAGVEPIVVRHDGTRPIIAVRTDIPNARTKEAKRIALRANRIAQLDLEWDPALLGDVLGEMPDLAAGLWTDDELADVLGRTEPTGEDAEPQIDKAAELQKQWGTETGQLWVLGEHRLLCGDSTKVDDVARLMGGENVELCFTSPPYAQQRKYTKPIEDWDALMQGVFSNLPMANNGQVLVNLGLVHRDGEWVPYWDSWIAWMRECGWRRFGWYVWDQGHGLMGNWNGRLAPSHEFVFHFIHKSKQPVKWIGVTSGSLHRAEQKRAAARGGHRVPGQRGADGIVKEMYSLDKCGQPFKIPDSVIRIGREQARGLHTDSHPAVYPPALPAFAMQTWSGDCYEPFCGSGTTIIAAQQLNRRCYAMEIAPEYVAVILQRFLDATGIEPRQADG